MSVGEQNENRPARSRLAIVVSHPTQYYAPWFRWISQSTSLEIRLFYLWDFGVEKLRDPHFEREIVWDVDLLSGYEFEFVPNESSKPGAEHFFGFRNPQLTKRLEAWNPEVILIFGYKWESHLKAAFWAHARKKPIIFRGDSTLLGRRSPPIHMRLALRWLFSRFSRFLYVGRANREYFEAFGVPSAKLFFAPHSVNSALFDPKNVADRDKARHLREELGLKVDTRTLLFAGKLIERKRPRELLAAFLKVREPNSALVFVGDGPEKSELMRLSADELGKSVHFLPFANQSEMPSRYLMAHAFALPSTQESWGLAVNEAMHMGLPCLASDVVGCQLDLVTERETGWVFPSGSQPELERALARTFEDIGSNRYATLISNVRERIARYTYSETTRGLIAALDSLGR
jgi:glycosyltransferase involved in cell wall biosynthesis